MAKKAPAKTKKIEETQVINETITDKLTYAGTITDGSFLSEKDMAKVTVVPSQVSIDTVDIDKLVAYEKACATVCKRYETRARLDGENNAMFQKFSQYYLDIVKEMEKRVEQACTTSKK